jgi:hypothetical protein
MANTLAAFGFDQSGIADGVGPNFGMAVVKVSSSDTTKIFRGDPVKRLATGYVAQSTAGTAASQLAGIFVSCKYLSVSQGRVVNSPYWPGADASGDVTAYIIPIAGAQSPKFRVQVSGTTQIAFADIGQNVDIALGTGNTTTGLSAATVAFSTLGATATLPFTVVDLWSNWAPPGANGVDNASANNIVIVQANTGQITGI